MKLNNYYCFGEMYFEGYYVGKYKSETKDQYEFKCYFTVIYSHLLDVMTIHTWEKDKGFWIDKNKIVNINILNKKCKDPRVFMQDNAEIHLEMQKTFLSDEIIERLKNKTEEEILTTYKSFVR